jgi:alkylresorcinol/alkylpyrone synthase
VARITADLFETSFSDFERLAPVYGNAAITHRYSCVPLGWYAEPHGLKHRNALYIENAVNLLENAARRALARAGLDDAEVDAVISVSTSGIATPSLDALIIERMNLSRDVERLPVFGLGCAGGVIGLARAGQMAISRPGSNVLLLVVELCGLTFRRDDHSKSNVIATALFGDGAAAAVLASEATTDGGAPILRAWGEHTWGGTLDVMGWNVEDDGLGVLFSRNIPSIVRRDYRAALDRFLAANDLSLGDMDRFAVHPGGAKVVDALEEGLGLDPGRLADTRAVLRDFGNMSATTVLFVLERILMDAEPSGRILVSSLGPGFTAGFLVLEQL